MDQMLDKLSRALGRRLPGPFSWIASLTWWIVFVVAMLSLWPDGYRAFGDVLAENGIAFGLPSSTVIVPVMISLTMAQLAHGMAIERRDILLGYLPQDSRTASMDIKERRKSLLVFCVMSAIAFGCVFYFAAFG